MLSFQNPAFFLFLLVIPLLYLLRKSGLFKRNTVPAVLSDWKGEGFEWKHKSQKLLSILAKLCYLASYITLIAALAGPVKNQKEKIYREAGTDIVFVMDTSPSMAAKDLGELTRLDAAKNAIRAIMELQGGYGFGLVSVGSEAAVTIPTTVNHQYFEETLENTVVGNMGDGSALGDGLSTAVYHLTNSSAEKKCIILLTDGENNAGKIHPETAAQLAREYDIKLYVVGIGSRGTIPIEYTDPKSGKTKAGYLESNYNSAALRKIALTGGGKYYEVLTIEELRSSLEAVASQEASEQSFTFKNSETTLYKKALLPAIILFLIGVIIRLLLLKGIFILRLKLQYKKRSLLRMGFLTAALIFALLAYSGISWGTYLAPVQKNSASVAMVFDISYSMLAKDCPRNMTRLETAALYAKELLAHMDTTSTSVVIAKGAGLEIIPMTQDQAAVNSLLQVISPELMTIPGSSIGKGILKAKESLPENFSTAGRIWVFTDGEESDGELGPALSECVKAGIPVSIIGFGQEDECAVLAGDGVTTVKSALRSESLRKTISSVEEKYKIFKNRASIQYINYAEKGSAVKLLSQLKEGGSDNMITSFEVKPIPRYKLFMLLCLISIMLSFICSELKLSRIKNKAGLASLLLFTGLFTGCSSPTASILKGSWSYHQGQYRTAVAAFKDAVENARTAKNQLALDYSLYNLGTTYAAMEEAEAAEKYFSAISDQAPDRLRFAAYYNKGVLAHKKGDLDGARESFRKALEIDSRNLDAKINLELSTQISEDSTRQNQSSAVQGQEDKSEHPEKEKSIFEHIKENDQKQWKNSEQSTSQNPADDF
ncbi:MAG: VWA domain-containing protein [Treponema sp.]|nr:VWA domain-containing protein [Treponema sp.]